MTRSIHRIAFLAIAITGTSLGQQLVPIHIDVNAAPGGNGSSQRPFTTLEEAQDKIRLIKTNNGGQLPGDVTVLIHEGVYQRQGPFVLTPEDSGTPHLVTYKAVPLTGGGYESVLISGGELLDQNWEEGGVSDPDGDETNAKWWGYTNLVVEVRDLWVNNVRLAPARYPDADDAQFLKLAAASNHYAIDSVPEDPSCGTTNLYQRLYFLEETLPELEKHNGGQNLVLETVSRINWTQSRQRWVKNSLDELSNVLWWPEVLHQGETLGMVLFDENLPLSSPFCFSNVHGPGTEDDNLDTLCAECNPPWSPGYYPGDDLYFERNRTFLTDTFEWIQYPEGYSGISGEPNQPSEFKINMLLPDDQQPGGIDPRGGATVAPITQQLLVARGNSQSDPISGVRFEGINFAYTHQPFPHTDVTGNPHFAEWNDPSSDPYAPDGILPGAFPGQAGNRPGEGQLLTPAIEFANAIDCEVVACRVAHTGGDGIWMHGWNNRISGCEVFDTGGHGIQVGFHNPSVPLGPRSADIIVEHNSVHDFGTVYHGHVGINAFRVDGVAIRHNEVANGPWSGIHMVGGFCNDSLGRCTDISFNHVYDVMLLHKDGDGIYVNGKHGGTDDEPCDPGLPRLEQNYVEFIPDGLANLRHGIRVDSGKGPPPSDDFGWNIVKNVVAYMDCPIHLNLRACDPYNQCPEDHTWATNYFWIPDDLIPMEIPPFACITNTTNPPIACPKDGLTQPDEWVSLGDFPQTWPQEAIDIANASGPDYSSWPNLLACEPLVHPGCP